MEYYDKIKNLRKKKGWTQQQLADEIKVSRQMITRWENGWNVPSLFFAQKLADCFDITVSDPMNGKSDDKDEKTENKSATKNYTAPRKSGDLLASAIWICVLSCFPVALYEILSVIKEAVRQYILLSVESDLPQAFIYRPVTDVLEIAFSAFCVVLLVLIFAWWIARFIGATRHTDRYERYTIYKQWNAGLIFLMANVTVLVFRAFLCYFSYSIAVEYIIGIFIGIFSDFIFDLIFRKATSKWMVGQSNRILKILNRIFLIVSGVVIGITVLLLIVFSVTVTHAYIAAYFLIAFFAVFAGATVAAYLVTRIILRLTLKEENEEAKQTTA